MTDLGRKTSWTLFEALLVLHRLGAIQMLYLCDATKVTKSYLISLERQGVWRRNNE